MALTRAPPVTRRPSPAWTPSAASVTAVTAVVSGVLLCVLLAADPAAAAAENNNEISGYQRGNFFINGRYGKRGQHDDEESAGAAAASGRAYLAPTAVGDSQPAPKHRIHSKSSRRSRGWFNFGRTSDYDPRPFYISTRYGKRAAAAATDEIPEQSAPLPYEIAEDVSSGSTLSCIYSGLSNLYHCIRHQEEQEEAPGDKATDSASAPAQQ